MHKQIWFRCETEPWKNCEPKFRLNRVQDISVLSAQRQGVVKATWFDPGCISGWLLMPYWAWGSKSHYYLRGLRWHRAWCAGCEACIRANWVLISIKTSELRRTCKYLWQTGGFRYCWYQPLLAAAARSVFVCTTCSCCRACAAMSIWRFLSMTWKHCCCWFVTVIE